MRVLIIGAGGHAQVVADILLRHQEQDGSVHPIGFLDDNPALDGRSFIGVPVLGNLGRLSEIDHDGVVIALGDNALRKRIYEVMRGRGERLVIARHPAAVVAPDVLIGPGSMICAGVVVNTGTEIGANVILNTSSSADHHNRIGDHVHIAPGAHLGGEVTLGEGVLVGIGATVMPRVRVSDWARIGAGACVHNPVPAGLTVVGVPARPLGRNPARKPGKT